jgi:hypothetical protein
MPPQNYDWDFFIAHAGPDKVAAEALYECLATKSRVFLDSRCLLLGDNWDEKLVEAQKAAVVTVVLVSSNTEQAYYQREEIAAAIALARSDKEKHRVVPVYIDQPGSVPYGLRLKHGIQVPESSGLGQAAVQLLGLLENLKSQAPAQGRLTAPDEEHLEEILKKLRELQLKNLIDNEILADAQRKAVDAWMKRSPLLR